MPLKRVDLRAKLPPLEWQVGGLLLRGYVNTVAALPGDGKTAVLTGLALQAARPEGGTFAGRKVWPTPTLYVDYDAPGKGRGFRYWLDQHRKAYPDGDQDKIELYEPDADTYGLGEGEMAQIMEIARKERVSFIIIDSFTSAFPDTDPVKLKAVSGPLWYLRRLATELNACVVLVEHMPKPMNGEKAGARGIIGSIVKKAMARSVYLLTRVPPKEVEGRHVLRWQCDKLSYAAMPEPFGLELKFNDGALTMEPCELPTEYAETKGDKAMRAMRDHLELKRGEVVPRKELLQVGIEAANVQQRTAELALTKLMERSGDELEKVTMPGKGSPVGYRRKAEEEKPETEKPYYHCGAALNGGNTEQDGEHLTQRGFAVNGEAALNGEGDSPPTDTRFKESSLLFDGRFSR